MSHRFAGIYTPIVTPFNSSGEIDERGMVANVDRYLASPLTGIVVLGSNGEAAQLDDDEADRAISVVRARVPRDRPLLVGTGRESTRATIAASQRAASIGADAVMARTPSFYKPQMTSEAFIRHYTAVADASPVPVLLYNVTMYTGVNLLPDAVEKLSEHPNIVGLKDSGNDMLQIGDYLASPCSPGRRRRCSRPRRSACTAQSSHWLESSPNCASSCSSTSAPAASATRDRCSGG
jgi:4-hydroxy-2-oxoglutarate aldolase